MNDRMITEILSKMTPEEKASICSGLNGADTKPISRLGIPSIKMHDGPNGLRREDETVDNKDTFGGYRPVPAICYPADCLLASSWDTELMESLGGLLGEECQAEQLPVLLGPAINMKRTPLCGRNFEYYSEDPYLAGKLAAAYIRGVQDQGIGTGLKHFAANNQELRRRTVNAVIDERTLREIYLTAFEIAVKEGRPWTVMCAYNRLNGEYCCENRWLLNDVLRDEWGFKGFVISDWGAVNDRVKSLAAGLELEMPASGPDNDEKILQAVQEGGLSLETLNTAVHRVLNVIFKCDQGQKPNTSYDKKAHHEKARSIAAQCMVLLKNESNILPLSGDRSIAVLGEFAQQARYQGGGCAHVLPTEVDCPYEEIRSYAADARYAPGYRIADEQPNEELIAEAVELAKSCDIAVVFAGLPEEMESEAFDRTDMKMPSSHERLIKAVGQANPNTVVVLMIGSPVEMEWADSVPGILNAYLGGQAAGGAIADLLFGKANPSGKLPESFPLRLEHNPSHLNYGMESDCNEYREGVFIGYRYYDIKNLPVRYPFGFGLSYTTFEYSDLQLNKKEMQDTDTLTVSMLIRNTGKMRGREVVQVYVHGGHEHVRRPYKELKGFCKVDLEPGEQKRIAVTLDKRAFAYYSTQLNDWYVESGQYEILAGASSRDIRMTGSIRVNSTAMWMPTVTDNTTVADLLDSPERKALLEELLLIHAPNLYKFYVAMDRENGCSFSIRMIQAEYRDITLRGLRMDSNGGISGQTLETYIQKMNDVHS